MQPFGIFSLLQSLLNNQNPQTAPSEPEQEIKENNVENAPLPQVENTANQENRQAVLHFFEAHEQRAKRTKKR